MRRPTRPVLSGLTTLALLSVGCFTDRATAPGLGIDPPEPAWTFCVAAGAPCDFQGLRTVRLGAANGPYVEKDAYHSIPCAVYGFDGRDPAPGQQLHCDYGPTKTVTLTNPMPGMAGLGATVVVPLGSPGASGPQLRAADEPPQATGQGGAFRTTCSLAVLRFDDPVVFPGRANASHLHMFFGNTTVDAFSTPASLASSGSSTCRGGTLNRTAYWTPALFHTGSGKVVTPDEATFYYKTGYNMDVRTIVPFPAGLRMIAGNKDATGPQPHVEWLCRAPDGSGVVNEAGTVPTSCAAGSHVRLTILFPQCWDGVNLDSPDHKSHMAYPVYRNPPEVSSCPPSHPVALPEITEHFDWLVTNAAAPAFWRLTSDMYGASVKGGLSAHADWVNGWDPPTMSTIVTQCLNTGLDCGVGSIGNGTTLY